MRTKVRRVWIAAVLVGAFFSPLGVDAKNCKKGCPCGNACIPCAHRCRVADPVLPAPKKQQSPSSKKGGGRGGARPFEVAALRQLWGSRERKWMLYDDCVRFSEVGEVHREKLTEDTQTLLASGWRWLDGCEPEPEGKHGR